MTPDYPWYQVVDGQSAIEQGDFIFKCPILEPITEIPEDDHISANLESYNVIVMSQSCDLIQGKIAIVLVCPFIALTEMCEANSYYKGSIGKESLRRGNQPGYHLLNRCDFREYGLSDFLVVDFHNVFGIHLNVLTSCLKSKSKGYVCYRHIGNIFPKPSPDFS